MIELNESSYVLGLWFIQWDECNWMCCAYRDGDEADWKIRYRFRYFADDRVFDSDDRRSWYGVTVSSRVLESEMAQKMEAFALLVSIARNAPIERLIVHGSINKLTELARDSPWFHSMLRTTTGAPS
jgi:hypothetical protein